MNTATDPFNSTTPDEYFPIAIERLFPSPTQPRKRFDEAKLKDLAESIKMQGVLQPILVRKAVPPTAKPVTSWPFPSPKIEKPAQPADEIQRFEIVAGERRFRAAKLAGLTDMPCFVRNLTDQQVLHAQVIENLQRDDLHPIEEAEGYERLMKEQDETGKPYTAESIGVEVGKSKAYVYGRLKLLALVPEARQAFYDDELDASTALLIARIPVAKLQTQAVKDITAKAVYGTSSHREGDTLMSYRTARDHIQREYMTDLAQAPFQIKDAKLSEKAGACTDCTKRTGNQPELFDDVKSKDVCTDTVCFAMKKTAHILAIQKEAEAKGCAVITGKAAKKLMPNPHWGSHPSPSPDSGYARLDSICPHDPEHRTWEEVLGKKAFAPAKDTGKPAVQKTLIEDTHRNELIPTIWLSSAIKALRDMGIEVKPAHTSSSAPSVKAQADQKDKIEQANTFRRRLFDTLHQQIEVDISGPKAFVAPGLYRILAERAFEQAGYDECEHLAKLYMPGTTIEDQDDLIGAFQQHIPNLTTQQHFLMMVDLMMLDEIKAGHYNYQSAPQMMTSIAQEVGIDAKAIEKEVDTEAKAAKKAASSAVKKTEAKKVPTPTKAAKAPDSGATEKTEAAAAWPFPEPSYFGWCADGAERKETA